MKHFFKCYGGRLCLLLHTIMFSNLGLFAQDYRVQRQAVLDRLDDLSGLNETLFLNAAVTSPNEVSYLRRIYDNESAKPEPGSAEEWQNLYERLYDADLRPPSGKIPQLDQLIETDPAKLTKSNIVPIGIIDLESIYLTDQELKANEENKKVGRMTDFYPMRNSELSMPPYFRKTYIKRM